MFVVTCLIVTVAVIGFAPSVSSASVSDECDESELDKTQLADCVNNNSDESTHSAVIEDTGENTASTPFYDVSVSGDTYTAVIQDGPDTDAENESEETSDNSDKSNNAVFNPSNTNSNSRIHMIEHLVGSGLSDWLNEDSESEEDGSKGGVIVDGS